MPLCTFENASSAMSHMMWTIGSFHAAKLMFMFAVPPLFVIEFLHRVMDIFEDYFTDCNESIIKENYVVVYEVSYSWVKLSWIDVRIYLFAASKQKGTTVKFLVRESLVKYHILQTLFHKMLFDILLGGDHLSFKSTSFCILAVSHKGFHCICIFSIHVFSDVHFFLS